MNTMFAVSVCVLSILSLSSSIKYEDVLFGEWKEFKLQHGKEYDSTEDRFRMKVFMENKYRIASHNQLFESGLKSYHLGMNEFGDMLHHEFVRTMNGLQRNYREKYENGSTYLSPANVQLPKYVDWRKEGYVTPVKNQGQCGSCWAFSTTGGLEGQHFRKTGRLVSLSEQNLVDCSGKYGNEGCNGGLMDQAFSYIKDNHGIDTEKAYPYEGQDGECRFRPKTVGATDTGFIDIPSGDEQKLAEAVATVGPVSVAIDASQGSFQFYKGGVYDEPECSSEDLDHGVLVVGYGNDSGVPYWIVKNSWGPSWGSKGYILMSRSKDNQCGIATQASYPLV